MTQLFKNIYFLSFLFILVSCNQEKEQALSLNSLITPDYKYNQDYFYCDLNKNVSLINLESFLSLFILNRIFLNEYLKIKYTCNSYPISYRVLRRPWRERDYHLFLWVVATSRAVAGPHTAAESQPCGACVAAATEDRCLLNARQRQNLRCQALESRRCPPPQCVRCT